ncbi:MAG: YihY/virulence factor BrkB family protein [Lachnospiraceae bacterium]|nr:YihY/virulence factor BrkB family protein [Lachnospiraceae bacterium]
MKAAVSTVCIREDDVKRLYFKGKEFTRNMRREHISAFAASSAFFLFLSFIPLLMLLSALITYTPLTREDLREGVASVVPGAVEGFMNAVIEDVYEKAQALLPVASVILLWTAGKGVLSIVQGLNSINQVEEHRGFFAVRLMAMFYTIVLLLVIMAGLGVLSFGDLLERVIEAQIPEFYEGISFLFPFRFLAFWVVLTVIFSLIYAYLPNKKMKLLRQIPGACFTAVAWGVFSFGFSVYLEYSNTFDVYGSLTILIVLMMWLYFCMYIVFVGAYMNRYFST